MSTLEQPGAKGNGDRDEEQIHQRVPELGEQGAPQRRGRRGRQLVAAETSPPCGDFAGVEPHGHVDLEVSGDLGR